MHVDEAGSHGQTGGFDELSRLRALEAVDRRNQPVLDPNVETRGWSTGTVDDPAATDEDVERSYASSSSPASWASSSRVIR